MRSGYFERLLGRYYEWRLSRITPRILETVANIGFTMGILQTYADSRHVFPAEVFEIERYIHKQKRELDELAKKREFLSDKLGLLATAA